MDKRAFLAGLGGLAVGTATAQTRAGDRAKAVAVLAPSTAANEEVTLKPFFDRMRELGWVEGRSITYERAFANDRHETLPELAARLVATAPDVVFAPPAAAAVAAQLRAAAVQVDKVLRGAQPADLPVEQPTVFELAVNLRTATQLGLRVPKTVLARADRLVE